jgi:hypothetical protein
VEVRLLSAALLAMVENLLGRGSAGKSSKQPLVYAIRFHDRAGDLRAHRIEFTNSCYNCGMNLKELIDIGFSKLAFISLTMFGLAGPPMLCIAVYEPALFKELEFSKLLTISLGISVPLFMLNLFVILISERKLLKAIEVNLSGDERFWAIASVASLCATGGLYVTLLARAFRPEINTRDALAITIALEIGIVCARLTQRAFLGRSKC